MELKDAALKLLDQNRKAAGCLAAAGVALLGLGLGYKYFGTRRKLTRVGVVSQLIIHPVKSGKGVRVARAECLRMGLRQGELRDRHWLVVTENGQMVTGRQEPRLVLVSMTVEGGDICLSGPNMEELRVPLHQPSNSIFDCRVFGADIQGRDCGEEVSQWLTRYLESDKTLRLVHFEHHMKARNPVEKEPAFPKDEKVAYPDIGAVMLLSEASLADLNTRLEKPVTVAQFRPSIVVSDCAAFSEDSWDNIQIGNVRMEHVMPCGRCVFTTVDPETGVISRKEPLDTLKSYRMKDSSQKLYNSSPLFGQYYTVKQTGNLKVGDPVYKISY
ncbi:mitochondrial amidoxime-reducing component 1 [Denticeps clupeoides]|nr:mitochondrial amidoxime-reducing component 1-like [Denticeps clupeoides]